MWATASVQSFLISQLAIASPFWSSTSPGLAASGRGEQCGLGGHGFFCALLLDLGEIGNDDLCHHRNAVPVSESVAGVEAAVSLQLNPGQLAEAEVLAGRGLLKAALSAVAEGRRSLRNQEDTGPCNVAGYVDHGILELSARVPRRSAGRLDPAEGRVRDRAIELAERSRQLKDVGEDPRGLGQDLPAHSDIIGILFDAHDLEVFATAKCVAMVV